MYVFIATCIVSIRQTQTPNHKLMCSLHDLFPLQSDIDECSSAVPYCSVDGNCHNTIGSYQCRCKEGFSGDGKECEGKNVPSHRINVVMNLV